MTSLTFISDTHTLHNQIPTGQLPGGDILIHTGDFTTRGNVIETSEFFNWFSSQTQYKHRVFIAGNHDRLAESGPSLFKSLVPDNCHYLEDCGIEIESLRFWGTPVTAKFCNWSFNQSPKELAYHFNLIPSNTDVLLTHGGPKHFLQGLENGLDVGMEELNEKLWDLPELKVNAFGHIHASFGHEIICETHFINSAICGENYKVANKPIHLVLCLASSREAPLIRV